MKDASTQCGTHAELAAVLGLDTRYHTTKQKALYPVLFSEEPHPC